MEFSAPGFILAPVLALVALKERMGADEALHFCISASCIIKKKNEMLAKLAGETRANPPRTCSFFLLLAPGLLPVPLPSLLAMLSTALF